MNTLDLDIVHSRETQNISHLLAALDDLGAEYRDLGGCKLRPAESHLTRLGPLDILGTIGRDMNYYDLLPHTSEMIVAENLTARVLDLATLIEIKEYLVTGKDRAVLSVRLSVGTKVSYSLKCLLSASPCDW